MGSFHSHMQMSRRFKLLHGHCLTLIPLRSFRVIMPPYEQAEQASMYIIKRYSATNKAVRAPKEEGAHACQALFPLLRTVNTDLQGGLMGKAKPAKHTAAEIKAKVAAATTNKGGGNAGKEDRLGGKAGHAKYKCPVCAQQAPDMKTMQVRSSGLTFTSCETLLELEWHGGIGSFFVCHSLL